MVVGAGPAGSSAARVAAERGARVLLLDRAAFPRYKTCGGGIIGTSLEWIPPSVRGEVVREVRRVRFTRDGRAPITITANRPFLGLVERERFDAALAEAAVAAGAEFRSGVAVRGVEQGDVAGAGDVIVRTDAGELRARVVVGADGTGGRVGAHVGVALDRVDLGLEDEVIADVPGDEVLLDWGPVPGSYAWLFPRGGVAVVGVIARRGAPQETRAYLASWAERTGTAAAERAHSSGHLTRVRAEDSPLVRGRVLVAGDAAGLLEPWTREGISAALRSGCWAGEAAAGAASGDSRALAVYAERVRAEFDPERRAGLRVLRVFERLPRLAHLALHTGPGQRFFVRFCLGRTRLSRIPLLAR